MDTTNDMRCYQVLSLLLQYPEHELIGALRELEAVLELRPSWRERLQPLLAHLGTTPLIDLQQHYVATFDRNPSHSLHLFEHIHGESRDRGQAMVDLLAEYRRHGLEMVGDDLPDYVPLFLEFLAQQDEDEARRLLGDAVHVLAHIGRKLTASGNPYGVLFAVLEAESPVPAENLTEPPVRDMDEALETFGPGADGVEPLLQTMPGGVQPLRFYPKHATA
ncbi:nitrate reductase molybdenum cofactor assembly chaperone [Massilia sp. YMA4]|uniref:nitrate reductase molybdenum cofactor assembly chaperone n=1 Tax=Massilia sp. YMA4 TaxID=1593482 RepID=UPI001D0C0BE4|nr:nitrate reductase molybdenum cofactor assembly chaperone [Massilia sp. YMA4]